MICKNCGQELKPGMRFCIGCGKPVENEEPVAETIPAENPVTFENNISAEPEQTPVENNVTAEPEQTPAENNVTAESEQPVAPVFSNPGHYGQGAGYYGNASNNVPAQNNAPYGGNMQNNSSYSGNVQNNVPYGNVQNNVPYGNMQNNANFNNATRPVYTAPEETKVKDEPLSAWAYFGLMLLFSSTCCVGWIFMFVFALSNDGNIHRKKFAQGYLIGWIFALVLAVVLIILYFAFGAYILSQIDYNVFDFPNNPFGNLVSMFIR